MLTKQQLIDAHEQGSIINTRNGNIKIVTILGDVYGVNHCDTNSKLVKWWMFENFERNQATIEQPKQKQKIDLSILKEGEIYYAKSTMYNYLFKFRYSTQSEIIWDSNVLLRDSEIYNLSGGIKLSYVTELRLLTESELELFYSKFPELKPKKYNGRAVKCDTVEQSNWLGSFELSQSDIDNNYVVKTDGGYCSKLFAIENNYEIISFSQYCTENGINEPKWIQGFEVGKEYNDVVMVSDDNENWYLEKLVGIKKHPVQGWQFETQLTYYRYCRLLKRSEINEIKFID